MQNQSSTKRKSGHAYSHSANFGIVAPTPKKLPIQAGVTSPSAYDHYNSLF